MNSISPLPHPFQIFNKFTSKSTISIWWVDAWMVESQWVYLISIENENSGQQNYIATTPSLEYEISRTDNSKPIFIFLIIKPPQLVSWNSAIKASVQLQRARNCMRNELVGITFSGEVVQLFEICIRGIQSRIQILSAHNWWIKQMKKVTH